MKKFLMVASLLVASAQAKNEFYPATKKEVAQFMREVWPTLDQKTKQKIAHPHATGDYAHFYNQHLWFARQRKFALGSVMFIVAFTGIVSFVASRAKSIASESSKN